jgi:hypothetical protein
MDVVGVVANIIQLIQFGEQILDRLEQYGTTLKGLPEALGHIHARIPILLNSLKKTRHSIDTGALDESARRALRPALRNCEAQIKLLNDIIAKVAPPPGAGKFKRTWKALESMRYDAKVEKIDGEIVKYVQFLDLHASTVNFVQVEGRWAFS